MTYIYEVATLNINGITSAIRLRMLDEFLHEQDIDIMLLQEVTDPNLNAINRYKAHVNQGKEGRATDILAKEGLTISNIKRLPSGSGMAAVFNGT
jgi:exonuclease III